MYVSCRLSSVKYWTGLWFFQFIAFILYILDLRGVYDSMQANT